MKSSHPWCSGHCSVQVSSTFCSLSWTKCEQGCHPAPTEARMRPHPHAASARFPCTARAMHLPTSYLPCSQKPLSHHWLTPADTAELEMGTRSTEDGSCSGHGVAHVLWSRPGPMSTSWGWVSGPPPCCTPHCDRVGAEARWPQPRHSGLREAPLWPSEVPRVIPPHRNEQRSLQDTPSPSQTHTPAPTHTHIHTHTPTHTVLWTCIYRP